MRRQELMEMPKKPIQRQKKKRKEGGSIDGDPTKPKKRRKNMSPGGLVSPSIPTKTGVAEDVPLDMAAIEQQIQAMLRALPGQNLEEPQV